MKIECPHSKDLENVTKSLQGRKIYKDQCVRCFHEPVLNFLSIERWRRTFHLHEMLQWILCWGQRYSYCWSRTSSVHKHDHDWKISRWTKRNHKTRYWQVRGGFGRSRVWNHLQNILFTVQNFRFRREQWVPSSDWIFSKHWIAIQETSSCGLVGANKPLWAHFNFITRAQKQKLPKLHKLWSINKFMVMLDLRECRLWSCQLGRHRWQ